MQIHIGVQIGAENIKRPECVIFLFKKEILCVCKIDAETVRNSIDWKTTAGEKKISSSLRERNLARTDSVSGNVFVVLCARRVEIYFLSVRSAFCRFQRRYTTYVLPYILLGSFDAIYFMRLVI